MRPLRLNIAALRAERPLRLRRSGGLLEDVAANAEGLRLSRRQLLGLSVSAGAALSVRTPAAKAVGATMLGEFDIVGDRNRVAFRLGGKERWVIDAARFGGSPAIAVERRDGKIRVAMTGALYPGTELPADFSCEVTPGLLGRKMKLDLALGGFSATLPLERWLAGAISARSSINADLPLCELRRGSALSLRGAADAEFFPDWTLRLAGDDIAHLDGLGGAIRSDSASISLADPNGESILDTRLSRRSLIVMERRGKSWPMEHSAAAGDAWRLSFGDGAFDMLHVETGEGAGNARPRALMAEGNGDAATVTVRPHGSLNGGNGDPFALPLRRPRYAMMFDGDEERTALVARYGADPVWLHTAGGSVLVGDDGSGGRFEIEHAAGSVERVDCAPALLSTYGPPMDHGVISQPVPVDAGRRLTFVQRGVAEVAGEMTDYLHLHPDGRDSGLKLASMRVSMVRPQDLLVLDFEFINLSLDSGGGGGRVMEEREKPELGTARRSTTTLRRGAGEAYIIVHFQPQNVAEEAFFEVDDTAHVPVKLPPNKDGSPHMPPDPDASTGGETPKKPPVQSRFAGASRLAFKVPAGTTSISYSLEAILKKLGELEMSVVPSALPPKMILWQIFPVYTISLNAATLFQTNAEKGMGVYKGGTVGVVDTHKVVVPKGGTLAPKGGIGGRSFRAATPVTDKYIYDKQVQRLSQNSGFSKYLTPVNDAEMASKLGAVYQIAVKPTLKKPSSNETSIESPYRLIISPHALSAWAHSATPVVSPMTGRSELWHTRLAVKGSTGPDESDALSSLRTIRAVWARSNPPYPAPSVSDHSNPEAFDPVEPQNWPRHGNVPFRMSLDAFDRHNIVHLSANFRLHFLREEYEPQPIQVERLMLTSLGAWMDTRGAWDKLPLGLSVEEWRHRGTMGRDNYVRVVYAGFLFPFGHRASLIKVTERKFQPHPNNSSVKVAYLRQRMFIVVREPEKIFGATGLKENDESFDLQMPFKRVKITTLVTPNLDPPENSDFPNLMMQSSFWPRVGAKDFQFHLVLEDLNGQESEITMPLQFIGKELTDEDSNATMLKIARQYNGEVVESPAYPVDRRERPFNGQQVAFAASKKQGDTSFEADTITFNARVPSDPAVYSHLPYIYPRFFPVVRKAKLTIPAIKHLVGNDSVAELEYHSEYLKSGFDGANAGDVFLKMASGGVDLSFDKKGDRSGGLVKPNMSISALSRALGPVAGSVDTITAGNFDPSDFFAGLNAKVFGCIDLFAILEPLGADKLDLMPKFVTEALNTVEAFMKDVEAFKGTLDALPGALSSAANTLKSDITTIIGDITSFNPGALPGALNDFVTHLKSMAASIPTTGGIDAAVKNEAMARLAQFQSTLSDVGDFVQKIKSFADAVEMAREMKVKFDWRPTIKAWGFDSAHPLFIPNRSDGLLISAEIRAKTEGNSSPSFQIICSLEDFIIDLIAPLSFMRLHFDKLQFFASSAKGADVNVVLNDIEFVGALSFVETLKDLIPLDGFSDPPALDITEKGIDASFSLALPSISVGMFSLQNLSLGAGFTIPFIGDPLSVRFNFCTRDEPFLLTVSLFGGGGFFGVTLTPAGIHILEASFEFGASISIDFGVASGGVHVMAGIYFKMVKEGSDDNCSLTGFFNLGGEVDVLGLISASLELELSLTYEFSSGKCVGKATLTIEVDVLFFSISVDIECERKFAGSKGDPSFEQLMAPYDTPTGEHVDPWAEYCHAFA